MTTAQTYDVIVVGGGPGGYVAAIRAAQLGLKTAVVEKDNMGGICLNWGCIPTKALLKGAEVGHSIQHAEDFGFKAENVSFDINKLVAHSRGVSARLVAGIDYLMKKNNIDVIKGTATVAGKCELSVQETGKESKTRYNADHIILATGARPRNLPGIEADGELIWTYFEAMVPKALPQKLLVIGSGAIGVEFSSLYNDLGTDVTLVEVVDQIMPVEDAEVSNLAQKQFKKRGIHVKTQTMVTAVTKGDNSVTCTLKDNKGNEEEITVDRVILAAGIQGNIEHLGLEALGVETEGSFIKTDAWSKTNLVGLYAIGDVAGPPCLAHKASHEGIICVEKIAGVAGVHPLDKSKIPGCTYARPQVASVGMTEAQAKAAGKSVKIGRFNYSANGKALAIKEEAGFVKVIFDAATGELLGAHMIGPEVTEQLQGFGLSQSLEATEEDLMQTIFAHPTVSEAMHEAVLDAYGRAIHQ